MTQLRYSDKFSYEVWWTNISSTCTFPVKQSQQQNKEKWSQGQGEGQAWTELSSLISDTCISFFSDLNLCILIIFFAIC